MMSLAVMGWIIDSSDRSAWREGLLYTFRVAESIITGKQP
jgi:hypothetical protein